MAKPGSDRDGAMVDKQAGKKVLHTFTRLADTYTPVLPAGRQAEYMVVQVRIIMACCSILNGCRPLHYVFTLMCSTV